MTTKQKKLFYKYRDLEKEEIEKTILNIIRIHDQILFDSSFIELCEYLNRLEEIFGEIRKCKIII